MRLLVIEDDKSFLIAFTEALCDVPGVEVETAESRESAFAKLESDGFDLIVCDLKLPTTDGALDSAIEHGLAVYNRAAEVASGTPIIILSAFGTLELVARFLQDAQQKDILGTKVEYPMRDFVQKANLPECIGRVVDFAESINRLDDIEVSTGGSRVDLSHYQKRALRIYARRLDGGIIEVSGIGGGLSSAKTLKLSLVDTRGAPRSLVVAKVSSLDKIEDEKQRYRTHVAPSLDVGAFTTCVDEVQAGAAKHGAIFYTLARAYDRSLFDLLRARSDRAAAVVRQLRTLLSRWIDGAPFIRTTVGEIRQAVLDDDEMVAPAFSLGGVDWQSFEEREVFIRQCSQHRDLHGLNVLVDENDTPVLIDYGEVGFASASFDPVTLELSLLFHPEGQEIRGAWPSERQAREWSDLDKYLVNCPVPEFVRVCREWAMAVGAGAREIYSNAYAYSVRQLKYADTDHDLAAALISSAISSFHNT